MSDVGHTDGCTTEEEQEGRGEGTVAMKGGGEGK